MYMYVCLHPVLYNSNHKHVGTISCLLEAKDKNNETVYIQCTRKGVFTLHRGDFRPGASSFQFPLMALYLFT